MSSPLSESERKSTADFLTSIKHFELEKAKEANALIVKNPEENKTRSKPFFERVCVRALKWYYAKRFED